MRTRDTGRVLERTEVRMRISSVKHVRTMFVNNLRFPVKSICVRVQSGPKARMKSVVDGQLVKNPAPISGSDGETQ